ncbi:tol-pal system protein YbgF [Govanella unica]|uniref:Cell division coordinator CpoB n=1 Tax=Govanella unica TaxID=2975056 RepID=A0A9X3TZP2_9PROT|nr:tol-pal system protein YbgF [Govania unica]MDA5194916.1 tol-pal system protein YbgF [Govania unica]
MGLSISVVRGAFLAVVVAGMVVCMACPASAQDVGKRVDKLEKELTAVQRKVFGRGYVPPVDEGEPEAPVANPLADMDVRVNSIESRLQQLTGQVEELRHKNDELAHRLESFMSDTEFRFNSLEGKGGTGGGTASAGGGMTETEGGGYGEPAASGGAATASTGGALPSGTPIEKYNYAYALLSKGKYPEAQSAFQSFLAQNPKDELAGSANYWLGQTYFVRGQYDQAAKVFLEGYQAYPKSAKAPDYLLKIGISLTKIKQTQDACAVFAELKTRFPNSPAAKDRMPAEKKVAGCK